MPCVAYSSSVWSFGRNSGRRRFFGVTPGGRSLCALMLAVGMTLWVLCALMLAVGMTLWVLCALMPLMPLASVLWGLMLAVGMTPLMVLWGLMPLLLPLLPLASVLWAVLAMPQSAVASMALRLPPLWSSGVTLVSPQI